MCHAGGVGVMQIIPLLECVGGVVTASADNLDAFTNCTIITGDLRISLLPIVGFP